MDERHIELILGDDKFVAVKPANLPDAPKNEQRVSRLLTSEDTDGDEGKNS